MSWTFWETLYLFHVPISWFVYQWHHEPECGSPGQDVLILLFVSGIFDFPPKWPFGYLLLTDEVFHRHLSTHRGLGGGRGRYLTSHASWDKSYGRGYPWHETWDLPPPCTSNLGPTPCYWHLVIITGNLFKLVHLRTYHRFPPPPKCWNLVVVIETCMVAKRAVRILLECCLVPSESIDKKLRKGKADSKEKSFY